MQLWLERVVLVDLFLDALHMGSLLLLILELSPCFAPAFKLVVYPADLLGVETKLLSTDKVLDAA